MTSRDLVVMPLVIHDYNDAGVNVLNDPPHLIYPPRFNIPPWFL